MEEARKEVGEIIDRLAVIYDEEDVNSPDIREKLEKLISEISTIKPSKLDRIIVELENDTGLDNVSDYLFWPELIDGLGKNADAETKIKKILEDRK